MKNKKIDPNKLSNFRILTKTKMKNIGGSQDYMVMCDDGTVGILPSAQSGLEWSLGNCPVEGIMVPLP